MKSSAPAWVVGAVAIILAIGLVGLLWMGKPVSDVLAALLGGTIGIVVPSPFGSVEHPPVVQDPHVAP